jgi:hypothetical protein
VITGNHELHKEVVGFFQSNFKAQENLIIIDQLDVLILFSE